MGPSRSMLDCQPSLCVAIDDWRYPATRRSPVGGLTIDSLRQYMCQNISSSIPAPRSDPLTPPPSLRKSTPLEHRNTPAHQPTAPTTPHPSPRPPTYHSPTPPLGSLDPLAPRPPPPTPKHPSTHSPTLHPSSPSPFLPFPSPPSPFPLAPPAPTVGALQSFPETHRDTQAGDMLDCRLADSPEMEIELKGLRLLAVM